VILSQRKAHLDKTECEHLEGLLKAEGPIIVELSFNVIERSFQFYLKTTTDSSVTVQIQLFRYDAGIEKQTEHTWTIDSGFDDDVKIVSTKSLYQSASRWRDMTPSINCLDIQ